MALVLEHIVTHVPCYELWDGNYPSNGCLVPVGDTHSVPRELTIATIASTFVDLEDLRVQNFIPHSIENFRTSTMPSRDDASTVTARPLRKSTSWRLPNSHGQGHVTVPIYSYKPRHLESVELRDYMGRGPGDHACLNETHHVRDVAYTIYFLARTPAGLSIPCRDGR